MSFSILNVWQGKQLAKLKTNQTILHTMKCNYVGFQCMFTFHTQPPATLYQVYV